MLLEENANVNVTTRDTNMTPLHWASYNGDVDVVKKLLRHVDIDPFIMSELGRLAIDIAGSCKHDAVVDEFLEAYRQKHISTEEISKNTDPTNLIVDFQSQFAVLSKKRIEQNSRRNTHTSLFKKHKVALEWVKPMKSRQKNEKKVKVMTAALHYLHWACRRDKLQVAE
jgi:ankyrin repeat protein